MWTSKAENATLSFSDVQLGSGYYYFSAKVKKGAKARLEIRSGSPDGLLLGTIKLDKNSKKINKGLAETFLRNAKDRQTICLVLKNNSGKAIKLSDLKFFAGSAK